MIINTYPRQYEKNETTVDGCPFFIRPIRPGDADLLAAHFASLSPRSVYMRFFTPIRQLSKEMLIRLTRVEYDREIALVALAGEPPSRKIVGVCRIIMMEDKTQGEFAIAISDTWQGRGVGSALLLQCLKGAKAMGLKTVMGVVLAENTQMLRLGKKLGFKRQLSAGSGEVELCIDIDNTNWEE